jgi:hypothetical protein
LGGFRSRHVNHSSSLESGIAARATLIWSRDVAATLYVNGSYVTDRVDPVDVDLAVRSDIWDDAFFLTAFSARHPGEEWLVDGYFNTTRSTQHMEDLFQEIQGSTVRKGIIQLVP